MCECYKIGGPFIAEDPDCPVHGREAREKEDEQETKFREMRHELQDLRQEVRDLRREIQELQPNV